MAAEYFLERSEFLHHLIQMQGCIGLGFEHIYEWLPAPSVGGCKRICNEELNLRLVYSYIGLHIWTDTPHRKIAYISNNDYDREFFREFSNELIKCSVCHI